MKKYIKIVKTIFFSLWFALFLAEIIALLDIRYSILSLPSMSHQMIVRASPTRMNNFSIFAWSQQQPDHFLFILSVCCLCWSIEWNSPNSRYFENENSFLFFSSFNRNFVALRMQFRLESHRWTVEPFTNGRVLVHFMNAKKSERIRTDDRANWCDPNRRCLCQTRTEILERFGDSSHIGVWWWCRHSYSRRFHRLRKKEKAKTIEFYFVLFLLSSFAGFSAVGRSAFCWSLLHNELTEMAPASGNNSVTNAVAISLDFYFIFFRIFCIFACWHSMTNVDDVLMNILLAHFLVRISGLLHRVINLP